MDTDRDHIAAASLAGTLNPQGVALASTQTVCADVTDGKDNVKCSLGLESRDPVIDHTSRPGVGDAVSGQLRASTPRPTQPTALAGREVAVDREVSLQYAAQTIGRALTPASLTQHASRHPHTTKLLFYTY